MATRYEVFCEHKFAQQGRQILAQAGIPVSHSGFGSATPRAVDPDQAGPPPPAV